MSFKALIFLYVVIIHIVISSKTFYKMRISEEKLNSFELKSQDASSDVHCSLVCNHNKGCGIFRFDEASSSCSIGERPMSYNLENDDTGAVSVFVRKICPEGGWSYLAHTEKCYKLFDSQKMTKEEASSFCKAFGPEVML